MFSAGEVSSNSGVYVTAEYRYGNDKGKADQIVIVKNVVTITPLPVIVPPFTPVVKTQATVIFTNKGDSKKLSLNNNDTWIIKPSSSGSTFCEKNRPTYCLNTIYGNLRSTVVSIENIKYALKLDPLSITAKNNLKFFKSQEN